MYIYIYYYIHRWSELACVPTDYRDVGSIVAGPPGVDLSPFTFPAAVRMQRIRLLRSPLRCMKAEGGLRGMCKRCPLNLILLRFRSIYIYIQLVNTSEYNFIGREHVHSDSATLGGCWWSAVGFFLGSDFQCWLESRVEIIVFVFEYGYIVNHDYVPSHYNEVHNYSFSGIYKHLFRYTTKHILGLTNRNTMNKACARDPSNLIWLILVVSNIVCSRPYLN